MADLIKVKGIKGKNSKKKWRKNIDVSAYMEDLERRNTQKIRDEYNAKNPQQLVVEDQNTRRAPLDPNRFKRKAVDPKWQAKHEKLLRKVVDLEGVQRGRVERKQQEEAQQEMYDPWGGASAKKPVQTKKSIEEEEKVVVPAVVIPKSGESYNPDKKQFNELIDEIIENEAPKKTKVVRTKKIQKVTKIVPRARNKKVRQEQLDAIKRKQDRIFQHQFSQLGAIKKQLKVEENKSQETIRKRLEEKEKLRKQMETGRITKGPQIIKERYQYRQDIIPDLQVAPLSKQEFRDSIVKDRYDSIFRRGIFEPKKFETHGNRKKNLKKKLIKDRATDEHQEV